MKAAGHAESYTNPLEGDLAYLATYADEQGWPPIDRITTGHLEEYLVYFRARPLWFGERAESLPVIVDEVLVNFDPDRAQHP